MAEFYEKDHPVQRGKKCFLNIGFMGIKRLRIRGGRFLDFLDFQPVATGSRCKMLF
jgi:hypothetical protein